MQIMKIEQAKARGLIQMPEPRPAPRQKPESIYRIELSQEERKRIEEDVAAGLIPF